MLINFLMMRYEVGSCLEKHFKLISIKNIVLSKFVKEKSFRKWKKRQKRTNTSVPFARITQRARFPAAQESNNRFLLTEVKEKTRANEFIDKRCFKLCK